MPWPVGRRSTGRVRRPSNVTDVPVRQSPLIVKLLERCCTVFERTNCSLLMLKEIEMGLQVLHAKSRILVDYIVSSGSTVFDNTSRMAIVAG